MKRKVLVMASTFPRWKDDTVPPFVYELSKRLVDRFSVYVLAPFSPGAKKHEISDKMSVHRFRYWFGKRLVADGAIMPNLRKNKLFYFQIPFFVLFEFIAMVRIMRRQKISTIHAHWIIPQGLLAIMYKIMFPRTRVVITTHGGDIFGAQSLNWLKRWVLNRCDHLTVVSHAIKKEVSTLGVRPSLPIDVIPMGVDSSKFNPKNKSTLLKKKYGITGPFLLFVGRLSEKKGVRYLLDAMPQVLKKFPKAKLLIVGDGEERNALHDQAKRLGLFGSSVLFLGALPQKDLPQFYATADVFANFSESEGFGLVCVEAGMSGCTFVGRRLPSFVEIFGDDYPYFSTSNDYGSSIIDAIEKPKRRPFLNYDWGLISNNYGDVI